MTNENIATLQAQANDLQARIKSLSQVRDNKNQHMPSLQDLKSCRIQAIAQGRADGNPTPETNELDTKIANLEKMIRHDEEQAEITAAEITILEKRLAEVEGEIAEVQQALLEANVKHFNGKYVAALKAYNKSLDKVREAESDARNAQDAAVQTVRDWLQGRYGAAIKEFQERRYPELFSKLNAVQCRPPVNTESAIVVSASGGNDAFLNLRGKGDLDEIFSTAADVLKSAAVVAEAQAIFLENDANKRELLKMLKTFSLQIQMLVKEKNVQVPEWAFSGTQIWREWTRDELIQPIGKWLHDLNHEVTRHVK